MREEGSVLRKRADVFKKVPGSVVKNRIFALVKPIGSASSSSSASLAWFFEEAGSIRAPVLLSYLAHSFVLKKICEK